MRWAVFAAAAGLISALSGPAQAAPDLRGAQWGLDLIDAERAWKVTQGAGVIVAVVDTGVDLKHPDLRKNLLDGYDFVDDDDAPMDEHGHGTLVAGIIAARRDGSGVTGVAPRASILPVRALDEDGTGEPGVVARAISWSVERGADVVNLSLSVVPGSSFAAQLYADRRVEDAIEAAAAKGVSVMIASGNDHEGGKADTSYDSDDPRVLVVGATTRADKRAAYSNYGPGLDVVAPGGGSATDPSGEGCKDQKRAVISTWWTSGDGSVYGATCGTSMATAYASGVAALLASRGADAHGIASRMLASADDLGARGRDNKTGAGRLNAARALNAPPVRPIATQPATPEPPTVSPASGEQPSTVATPGKQTSRPSPRASASESLPPVVQAVPAPGISDDERGGSVIAAVALIGLAAALQLLRHRMLRGG